MTTDVEKIQMTDWHDCYVEFVEMGKNDAVTIFIRRYDKTDVRIKCERYLSLAHCNYWDEALVEGISIRNDSELISAVKRTIIENHPEIETYPDYNADAQLIQSGTWFELRIEFLDSSYLQVVCNNIGLVT